MNNRVEQDITVKDNDFFRINMEALEQHQSELAQWLKNQPDNFVIKGARLNSGEYVLVHEIDTGWAFFHEQGFYSLQNILPEMDDYVRNIKEQKSGFVMFGLDVGLRLLHLFYNTEQFTLFVVERYPELFKALMTQFDLRKVFSSQRVFFFVGEDSGAQITDFLVKNPQVYLPYLGAIFCRAIDKNYYDTVFQSLAVSVTKLFQKEQSSIAARYTRITKGELIDLFNPQRRAKLRILGDLSTETTVMQYATEDCMEAFRGLGHETFVIRTDFPDIHIKYVYKVIHNFFPHLWFRINHANPFYHFENFITLIWVQDPFLPLFDPAVKYEDKIGKYDQLFVVNKLFIQQLKKAGFPDAKLHFLPFSSNTGKFHPRKLTSAEQEKYSCRISFVSHYPPIKYTHRFVSAKCADFICQRMSSEDRYYWDDFKRIYDEFKEDYRRMQLSDIELIYHVWSVLGNAALKLPYLEAITDLDLHIYGDGWKADPRFSACAQGVARDGEEACKVYNASKINLNLSLVSNNHKRIFDAIASGGFVLTRLTPEDEGEAGIGEFFEIGKEIEVFRTKEELRQKVEYYLKHEDERKEIARRGTERLLREHAMEHRMEQVLDVVYKGILQI